MFENKEVRGIRKKRGELFTLMVIPHNLSRVRRLRVHKISFFLVLVGFLLVGLTLFYFVNDYRQIKSKMIYLSQLEQLSQMQKQKIHSLAKQVEEFNVTMKKLEELENRLRMLAGLGTKSSIGAGEGIGKGGPVSYPALDEEEVSWDSSGLIEKIENNVVTLNSQVKQQEESFDRIEKVILEKEDLFASTPNIFPTQGWISSGYGWRINPFTRQREFHEAIDLAAPWGSEIRAAAQGKVTYAGWKGGYGLLIRIADGYGYSTVYGHLSKILVKKAAWVSKGQIIGRVGSTGRSTGPHLHFEVWHNGKAINPLNLMVESLG